MKGLGFATKAATGGLFSGPRTAGNMGARYWPQVRAMSGPSAIMDQETGASTDKELRIELETPFLAHKVPLPEGVASTTPQELVNMFRQMASIRRMEILADGLYKSRQIRGFCHLYDGQEAVAVGMEAALTRQDSVITAYRQHGLYLGRGGTVFAAMAELMGKAAGCARGKGGSMHFYLRENNYFGGWGIVGTSPPLGTGLAYATKTLGGALSGTVVAALYGDGAANQGQIYEAMNMAALWDLPVIYVVENNHYGMGTAEWRASKQTSFYNRLSYVPGLKVNGMDVLAVKQAFKYAKERCLGGEGPIVLEMDTYRYHGHSMSDPGLVYRARSEVSEIRQRRDPIAHVREIIVREKVMSEDDLKNMEKSIRADVDNDMANARDAAAPVPEELFHHVYRHDAGYVYHGCDAKVSMFRCP